MANYLIIAGTSSIGYVTAEKLLQLGHRIIITGRDENKTKSLANKLNTDFLLIDATQFEQVNSAFEAAINNLGSLDGVVNCSGSLLLKPAHCTSINEFEQTISINLTTAFAVCAAAGKYLSSSGGSVVLISSAAALIGLSNHEAIAAAKAGIIGLAQSAASTYAPKNLRFNVIAPGLIETTLTKKLTSDPISRKISESMHPLGRIGKPEDIAEAIIFFLNPNNSWVTGQVLAIDGGLSSLNKKIKA
jgi:NAD(P)-dependent dehydrogenase (short-subunit alcohol dehydrogenase family)